MPTGLSMIVVGIYLSILSLLVVPLFFLLLSFFSSSLQSKIKTSITYTGLMMDEPTT